MTNEDEPARQRRLKRYRVLRDSGVPANEARRCSRSPSRFVPALKLMGVDPDTVDADGDLRRVRTGGRARLCTPQSEAKSARYRALRNAGVDALEASVGAQTPATFARAVRVLALKGVRVALPEAAE
jgi:hypothetical protein